MIFTKTWQLIIRTPYTALGVCCDEDFISEINYLPPETQEIKAQNLLAGEVKLQLQSYFKSPRQYRFSLPLLPAKTLHAQKLRALLENIPAGETLTYKQAAALLGHSSARGVGSGCRTNPIALVVPCHRIVSTNGGVGGFMGTAFHPDLKTALLQLEGAL